jgi:hypothetical protein
VLAQTGTADEKRDALRYRLDRDDARRRHRPITLPKVGISAKPER